MIKVIAGVVVGLASFGSSSAIAQETGWGLNESQENRIKAAICEYYGQGYKNERIIDELLPTVKAKMIQNYFRIERERPDEQTKEKIFAVSELSLAIMKSDILLGDYPCEHINRGY